MPSVLATRAASRVEFVTRICLLPRGRTKAGGGGADGRTVGARDEIYLLPPARKSGHMGARTGERLRASARARREREGLGGARQELLQYLSPYGQLKRARKLRSTCDWRRFVPLWRSPQSWSRAKLSCGALAQRSGGPPAAVAPPHSSQRSDVVSPPPRASSGEAVGANGPGGGWTLALSDDVVSGSSGPLCAAQRRATANTASKIAHNAIRSRRMPLVCCSRLIAER